MLQFNIGSNQLCYHLMFEDDGYYHCGVFAGRIFGFVVLCLDFNAVVPDGDDCFFPCFGETVGGYGDTWDSDGGFGDAHLSILREIVLQTGAGLMWLFLIHFIYYRPISSSVIL